MGLGKGGLGGLGRNWEDLEDLQTWGSGGNDAWQILVRPTQFCPGRAGCGPSQNLPDPMPEAWILALVRPTQKNVGRESSGNAGVEQILAGGGTFSTPAILPGSSRIWRRPDLARPWGLAKSGPGPMWARAQVRDPKISDAKEQSFFRRFRRGPPKGYAWYGPN